MVVFIWVFYGITFWIFRFNYGRYVYVTPYIWFSVIFVVVGATFGTYLLNPLALRHLRASTVTVFIYMQPLIAGIFAIIMGSDTVTVVKILASALIFLGVYLVTKKPKLQA
ncbi:EamA family transporter [Mesoflavibacter sp. CH_XMU1404-2]|uniref:EamA family transporter n=1 Tax=Mesoflavibacter sp. CH_XMU1404-2 TaxID=3107766 RepID=UPI003008F8DC